MSKLRNHFQYLTKTLDDVLQSLEGDQNFKSVGEAHSELVCLDKDLRLLGRGKAWDNRQDPRKVAPLLVERTQGDPVKRGRERAHWERTITRNVSKEELRAMIGSATVRFECLLLTHLSPKELLSILPKTNLGAATFVSYARQLKSSMFQSRAGGKEAITRLGIALDEADLDGVWQPGTRGSIELDNEQNVGLRSIAGQLHSMLDSIASVQVKDAQRSIGELTNYLHHEAWGRKQTIAWETNTLIQQFSTFLITEYATSDLDRSHLFKYRILLKTLERTISEMESKPVI